MEFQKRMRSVYIKPIELKKVMIHPEALHIFDKESPSIDPKSSKLRRDREIEDVRTQIIK